MSQLGILTTEATSKNCGVKALRKINFDVQPGAVHGLIGPNGSGKTTLFNVVSGVLGNVMACRYLHTEADILGRFFHLPFKNPSRRRPFAKHP